MRTKNARRTADSSTADSGATRSGLVVLHPLPEVGGVVLDHPDDEAVVVEGVDDHHDGEPLPVRERALEAPHDALLAVNTMTGSSAKGSWMDCSVLSHSFICALTPGLFAASRAITTAGPMANRRVMSMM